jgi:hypothetical protein
MVDIDHVKALQTYFRRRVRFASAVQPLWPPRDGPVADRTREVWEGRITVALFSAVRIVLIERAPERHAAIDTAVDRLTRTIARRMDRGRSSSNLVDTPRRWS